MSFNITLKSAGETKTKTVDGIKALHSSLTKFKNEGLEVVDISRVL